MELTIERRQTIASEILRELDPKMEAVNPLMTLKRKLVHCCHGLKDPVKKTHEATGLLVPSLVTLVLSKRIDFEEAISFTAEALSWVVDLKFGHDFGSRFFSSLKMH